MSVYQLRPDPNHYSGLQLEQDSWGFFFRFKGKRIADTWTPKVVKSTPPQEGRRTKDQNGDFPSLSAGNIPVLSRRALEVLRSLIENAVELLPLAHPNLELYAVNVLDVLDCVDYDRSEYTRYATGGVKEIVRWAFKPGALEGRHIFKVKRFEVDCPFVSEELKRRVEQAGLLGFEFWPIDGNGKLHKPAVRVRHRRAR